MNLWTIPLRISLTCLAYPAFAVFAPHVVTCADPTGFDPAKVALLFGWTFGMLAIWCWGWK